MNNALLYLGGILVTALAVLFAVPYFVDWNTYRGVFEEEASRVLGREVRVGGSVNLRLLPAPYVRFDKLRIADAGGEGGTSIFRAESFTMWLSVPPLLRGVLEANQVQLKRPVLQLAIDRNGSGNLRTLRINPGAMPFVPKGVALQSVRIFEGVVALSAPERGELVRFESINGEFAAEALEGPYKFRGSLIWGGAGRDVRLATARQDPNGDVRFKVSVDVPDSANGYVMDGRLSDLSGVPRIEGEVSAKLAFTLGTGPPAKELVPPPAPIEDLVPAPSAGSPGAPGPAAPAEQSVPVPAPAGENGPPRIDLRAKVSGDTAGLELSDVSLTLEQAGAPQLITGSGKLAWADRVHFEVALRSRWLDLDRFVGHGGAGMVPLAAARGFFEALAAALPTETDTNATLHFDQLNLGGEVVSDVHLAATRANGPLELKGVRAGLPGGARIELDGVLVPGAKAPKFDGSIWLAGQSLMRFLGWGFREKEIGTGRIDGPFSVEGRFALGDSALELVDAAAEFGGMQLSGDVRLGLGARKRLALALEGSRIDIGQIYSGAIGLGLLDTVIFGPGAGARKGGEAGPAAPRFLDPQSTDMALKLRLAEVVDGTLTLRDVETELSVERGRLSMPVLKFSTPEGLAVEAEGEAANVPAAPKGGLRALIDAPSPEAVTALLGLLELPEDRKAVAKRLPSLAPIRLAGTLDIRGRSETAADVMLDGTMHGGRVRAAVRLDGGRDGWRTAPVDVTVTVDSPAVEDFLAALLDAPPAKRAGAPPSAPGQVVLKAVGTPESGVAALAAVSAQGLKLDYSGRVKLPPAGTPTVSGALSVAAADARAVLTLAGVRLGEGAAGVPLAGDVTVSAGDGGLAFRAQELKVGESTLRGEISLRSSDSGTRAVSADIEADSATFSGLLAPVLGPASAIAITPPPPVPAKAAPPAAPAVEARPVWPEQPFDLSSVRPVEGRLTARFGTLELEPGLAIKSARLVASLAAGGIKVEVLEGGALGGRLSSSVSIDKAPAGVVLAGSLEIEVAGGPQGAGAQKSAATEAAKLSAQFSGRGLSPSALIGDLEGKGEITIGDATLSGMSPSAVAAVAENALAGKGPSGGEALVESLKTALKQGEIKLGKLSVPVVVRDGALRLDKVQIESKDGRATFATAVELATMRIDSEWQIEPKVARSLAPSAERSFLPAVSVVYVGKLSELGTLEPRLGTGALESELQVRKMERDVEELERLRKLDQARAREEEERRKALEAERTRTSPMSSVPSGATTTPAPQAPAAPSGASAFPAAPEEGAGGEASPPDAAGGPTPESPQGSAAAAPPQGAPLPPGAAQGAGDQGGTAAAAAASASAAVAGDPAVQKGAPETPRPARKRKPPAEEWRPFQGTPF